MPKEFKASVNSYLGNAYFVELRDGMLQYSRRQRERGALHTSSETIVPTRQQWAEFRRSLDQIEIWRWRSRYSNDAITDGTEWRLDIAYPDKARRSVGFNDYPPRFGDYLAAVQKLLGNKPFNP